MKAFRFVLAASLAVFLYSESLPKKRQPALQGWINACDTELESMKAHGKNVEREGHYIDSLKSLESISWQDSARHSPFTQVP